MNQELRNHVMNLMQEKEKLEREIRNLTEILTLNGVGMNDPLVDAEGFPINAIDVYQVRHARHKIICLQNDHKALMKRIEDGLEGYYTAANNQPAQNGHIQDVEMSNGHTDRQLNEIPFLKVGNIEQGSPADLAGLKEHDQIVEFGSVNFKNFKGLNNVATVVQHSENKDVIVRVKRGAGGNFVSLILTPKKWRGQGLLGCRLAPL